MPQLTSHDTTEPTAASSAADASSRPPRRLVLQKLVELLVEQAGARKGVYLSIGDRLEIEATSGVGEPAAGLPSSILESVRRGRAKIVLDDAVLPNAFSADEYLVRRRPRSVACLPVMRQDELLGLVYLENDVQPGVFTPERLALLELLATQTGQFAGCDAVYAALRRKSLEQRDAEAALRASREQLQAILDNMVAAVFVCDATGRITLTNVSALEYLDLPRDHEVLRSVGELSEWLRARHPDGRPFAPDELPLLRALRGEVVSAMEMTLTNPRTGREMHLRLNAAPIQDQNGAIAGAVAAAINITESVELDHLKGDFLRIAAHELKTPVAIVKGYADTLRRSAENITPGQRKMLEALVRGADRIDRIASNLVFLQQLRTGRVELVLEDELDLVELAHSAVRRLEPEPRSGRVKVSSTGPVTAPGDRQLLGQVLVNLVANALRYSPSGGEVEVELVRDEHQAVVSVADHGVGIPAHKQAHVFEAFYRAHTDTPYDYGGMGGGLYLAKAIVDRHGGEISFTSVEGRGSTFTVRLPTRR